eukprot:CAMPEP_0204529334 /NCGR_PEP_ID=MMETSP0661-20131031/10008_1 /ASSEMBLY_ACC=CAM_ASM_000606 /TAXON_ID=109239 /ORGANISM="Alexandrium margalefi, Strain AMGDE01CS-322" /LENGTH=531 /DNA_ID=CAMNT_0051535351 /DNA_START=41 /DNA_END=1636 /DNA_ORIENTATION=+
MPLISVLLSAALLGSAASIFEAADAGFDLLVTSAGPATPRTCLRAPGLPAFVNGSYFVAGPARFELGDYHFQAIFDGYGKMNRFELQGGSICYTSAWMNTRIYEKSVKEGRPCASLLFEETKPSRPSCGMPMCNVLGPNDNNWVNVVPLDGEALLMTDSPQMLTMDPGSLQIAGAKPWADDHNSGMGQPMPSWMLGMHAAVMGSAHPLQIPGTQTWVEVLGEMPEGLGRNWVDVYTFDGSVSAPQRRVKIGSIQTPDTQYIHSFGVTPKHVVLTFDLQMKVNPLNFDTLLGAIQGDWQGIHAMDMSGRWQAFTAEPFFHVHTVNTFENDTGIVMDVGFFRELPFAKTPQLDIGLFVNKTARDANTVRGGVRRLHLHTVGPLTGTATHEDLVPPGRSVDFYQINPDYRGLPYCIYYAVEWWHDDVTFASMGILKHNICKGTRTYWSRSDVYPGEPFFVGGGGAAAAEDDGVVVFVALDGRNRGSLFVTLDGRTMDEVSVVGLPGGHIPFTAHGNFIPSRAVGHTVSPSDILV